MYFWISIQWYTQYTPTVGRTRLLGVGVCYLAAHMLTCWHLNLDRTSLQLAYPVLYHGSFNHNYLGFYYAFYGIILQRTSYNTILSGNQFNRQASLSTTFRLNHSQTQPADPTGYTWETRCELKCAYKRGSTVICMHFIYKKWIIKHMFQFI